MIAFTPTPGAAQARSRNQISAAPFARARSPIGFPGDRSIDRALQLLDAAGAAYLVLGHTGRVLLMSEEATTLLGGDVTLQNIVAEFEPLLTAGAGVVERVLGAEGLHVTLVRLSETCEAAGVLVLRLSARRSAPCDPTDSCLTGRERDVARLIAAGHTARQIATLLGISYHTVRRHGERVFRKLGVHNRIGVARAMA